jgi:hypothetical protein
MSDKKVRASAQVTVTLRISVCDTWGADCTVKQIHSQAAASAVGILNKMRGSMSPHPVEIVGQPKVNAIFVEDET